MAGTIALDIIPQFPEEENRDTLLAEGKTIYIDGIDLMLGGCVSNTGIAMHRLGADVTLTSKVGDDPLSPVLSGLLDQEGVKNRLLVSKGQASSATIVAAAKNRDRTFWHRRGASQIYDFYDLPYEMLQEADLFHFGYPTGMRCMHVDGGERLSGLFRKVKELGITTSMDLSLPGKNSDSGKADWKVILGKTLPYVDIFLPSLEEVLFLFHRDIYLDILNRAKGQYAIDYIDLTVLDELGDEMMDLGVKIFGLKLGKKGFYLRTADSHGFAEFGKLSDVLAKNWFGRELLDPPYKPERMISTNGAGDTAIAGFLCGMMEGYNAYECIRLANAAAATRIESASGVHGLDNIRRIAERIQGGWEKIQIENMGPKWKANPLTGTLIGSKDAYQR